MTTELQDLAWACLPDRVRVEIQTRYDGLKAAAANVHYPKTSRRKTSLRVDEIERLYGTRNLNGASEPPKAYIVWRKDVQETYAYNEQILKYDPEHKGAQLLKSYLLRTYGDGCLPDNSAQNHTENCDTENLNSNSDNMEADINLCPLIKGCEGNEIFNIATGEAIIAKVTDTTLEFDNLNGKGRIVCLGKSVRIHPTGTALFYPSRESFAKYPLDAARAWSEWAESRKPKWWRAKDGEIFYVITTDGKVGNMNELFSNYTSDLYKLGNYFSTRELAKEAAEEVSKTLESFHERKEGEK